jgi:hypothetical protein
MSDTVLIALPSSAEPGKRIDVKSVIIFEGYLILIARLIAPCIIGCGNCGVDNTAAFRQSASLNNFWIIITIIISKTVSGKFKTMCIDVVALLHAGFSLALTISRRAPLQGFHGVLGRKWQRIPFAMLYPPHINKQRYLTLYIAYNRRKAGKGGGAGLPKHYGVLRAQQIK